MYCSLHANVGTDFQFVQSLTVSIGSVRQRYKTNAASQVHKLRYNSQKGFFLVTFPHRKIERAMNIFWNDRVQNSSLSQSHFLKNSLHIQKQYGKFIGCCLWSHISHSFHSTFCSQDFSSNHNNYMICYIDAPIITLALKLAEARDLIYTVMDYCRMSTFMFIKIPQCIPREWNMPKIKEVWNMP